MDVSNIEIKNKGIEEYELSISKINKNKKNSFFKEFRDNGLLYLMTLPGIIVLLIFCYAPMSGIYMAFTDYNIKEGIFGSKFVGLQNFLYFFTDGGMALRVTYNTIILNTFYIITGLVFPILISIFLNEVNNKLFKKATQMFLFFPYFLSWVVIGAIIYSLFSSDVGVVNTILKSFGAEPVRWYAEPKYWKAILVGANVWKWTGYSTIVYLAAMVNFDNALYEAAIVDGATKFQQIRNITLPLIKPTAIVLTLLSIGRIFYGDFAMIYGIVGDNGVLKDATTVIDTYVYSAMRTLGFSLASAIGLYQSVMGLILVTLTNHLAKKINDGEGLF